jgi:hypothetical protein
MAWNPDVRKYMDGLDDRQLGCLAGGHDWPLDHLRPGKPVPRDLRADPTEVRGAYVMVERCRNRCGKQRTCLRNSDGSLERFAYALLPDRPGEQPRWQVRPEGLGLTRRDFRAEVINMSLGELTR